MRSVSITIFKERQTSALYSLRLTDFRSNDNNSNYSGLTEADLLVRLAALLPLNNTDLKRISELLREQGTYFSSMDLAEAAYIRVFGE